MLRAATRVLASWVRKLVREEANIRVNKPYKPRILKNDLAHRMARQVYKMKSRSPDFKRKAKLYRKKYVQKNGRQLKMRAERVREIRKDRGLDDNNN